jgi:hypothetical protein
VYLNPPAEVTVLKQPRDLWLEPASVRLGECWNLHDDLPPFSIDIRREFQPAAAASVSTAVFMTS